METVQGRGRRVRRTPITVNAQIDRVCFSNTLVSWLWLPLPWPHLWTICRKISLLDMEDFIGGEVQSDGSEVLRRWDGDDFIMFVMKCPLFGYVTINPLDLQSLLVLRLAGHNYSGGDLPQDCSHSPRLLIPLLLKSPCLGSKWPTRSPVFLSRCQASTISGPLRPGAPFATDPSKMVWGIIRRFQADGYPQTVYWRFHPKTQVRDNL